MTRRDPFVVTFSEYLKAGGLSGVLEDELRKGLGDEIPWYLPRNLAQHTGTIASPLNPSLWQRFVDWRRRSRLLKVGFRAIENPPPGLHTVVQEGIGLRWSLGYHTVYMPSEDFQRLFDGTIFQLSHPCTDYVICGGKVYFLNRVASF